LLFRWIVFMDGQMIPKTGAGTYTWHMPAGSDGWLGIIGVFGLWLFAAIAVSSLAANKADDAARQAAPAE
jgi:tetrathionate reductase subunit C